MIGRSTSNQTYALPNNWELKTLKEIAPRINVGLVINPSTYFDEAGTVPMLVGSNISPSGIDWTKANRITERSNATLKASRIYKNDVVVVRVGEPGIAAVVPEELDNANCASLIIVRKNGQFDSDWLRSTFNSPLGRSLVAQSQYGTAQKVLNIGDAVKLCFPVPPMAEQKAIAEALSDADKLIEGLERLIAKKRLVKQGAMQQLLTAKRRLPGFSGDWEERTLPELAEIRSGGTPSTTNPAMWDGDIAWCTPTDITALKGSRFLSHTARTITELGLRKSAAELLPVGTVVMTSRATIGECAIAKIPISTNQGFKNFIARDGTDRDFFYYLLAMQKPGFIELCSGSTFLEIGMSQLRRYSVSVPSKPAEQTAIARVLVDMDAEIQALENRLEKACQVKDGMMQNLLTGRIRLI